MIKVGKQRHTARMQEKKMEENKKRKTGRRTTKTIEYRN